MEFYVDVKKKFPGFTLQVQLSSSKEIIGILGASGSGKSMLLNMIAGLVKPDQGRIIINNKTLFDSERKINLHPRERKVGLLFQNYALFPHLTIADNIAFGLDGLAKPEKSARVAALMAKCRLKDMAKRYPAQISGGQQQRVALARALAVEPEILLLDEPFSALDDYLRSQMLKEMLELLKEFQGATVFVTHNIEEAYLLCDRIAILKAGRVETFARHTELFQRPVSLETAKITGCKNIFPAVKRSGDTILLEDPGIEVKTAMPVESGSGFAGIRSHLIELAQEGGENRFPAWIADESEAPFHTTLYLKIGSKPQNPADYHLQWEIGPEERAKIAGLKQPLSIYLPPAHVFFVAN